MIATLERCTQGGQPFDHHRPVGGFDAVVEHTTPFCIDGTRIGIGRGERLDERQTLHACRLHQRCLAARVTHVRIGAEFQQPQGRVAFVRYVAQARQ